MSIWPKHFLVFFLATSIAIGLSTMAGNILEASAIEVEDRGTTAYKLAASDSRPHMDAKPHKCCHEKDGKFEGRNLIVCIDGTANQYGEKNTNVIELYNLILKEVEDNQRTWYNSGIGTYARPSWKSPKFYRQVLYHMVDLAIAWDFEKTVLGAYRWLSDNYERGDLIFLFGFSRGAFQVRILSAMIEKVGLIYKGNEMQIPFAYELYADPHSNVSNQDTIQVGSKDLTSSAARFKTAFSYKDVKVHFVGAWDTVSSIGIARTRMLPGTVDGMQHVCFFRHALALDERRVKFSPEYAYGGSSRPPQNPANPATSRPNGGQSDLLPHIDTETGETNSSKNPVIKESREVPLVATKQPPGPPQTLEVWFPGTHSDIGGGNVKNENMDRSRPPLRWMVYEAGKLGLRTALFERELDSTQQFEIKESLTGVWWLLELLPLNRLTYTRREEGKKQTHKPHLGSSRKIHDGQKIHSSFLLGDKTLPYTPKARPVGDDPSFWAKAHKDGLGEWLELDLYQYVDDLVKRFVEKLDHNLLENLLQTASWGDGRQAVNECLYKRVIGALNNAEYNKKCELLQSTVDILKKSPYELKRSNFVAIRNLVLGLDTSNDSNYRKTVMNFYYQCTNCCVYELRGHQGPIFSVAFSPNGKRIVSGSSDKTLRIWNSETGRQVGEPFVGHTVWVSSVTFSPDGKGVVSGSRDNTVREWDSETGLQVGELRNTDSVSSIVFSSDGKCVVWGSHDGTVRVWDLETRQQVREPLKGSPCLVSSVAFSPDGKRVVAGSHDKTVRVWHLETGEQVAFRGHTYWVMSVAFSPDGKRVVSGSGDGTVRVWDSETEKQVGKSFQGHTGWVNSVAFSPDGKHIVSGSDDKTVRIWDSETGSQVGEPLQGHTESIECVAFSRDGQRVVSGSGDRTIRIWHVRMYVECTA